MNPQNKKLLQLILLFLFSWTTRGQENRYDNLPEEPIPGKCYVKVSEFSFEQKMGTYLINNGDFNNNLKFDTIRQLILPSHKGLGYKRDFEPCDNPYKDCIEIKKGKKEAVYKEIISVLEEVPSNQLKRQIYFYYEKQNDDEVEYWQEVDCNDLAKKSIDWDISKTDNRIDDWTKEEIEDKIISMLEDYPDVYVEIKLHTNREEDWQKAMKETEEKIEEILQFLETKGIGRYRILALPFGDLLNKGKKLEFEIKM